MSTAKARVQTALPESCEALMTVGQVAGALGVTTRQIHLMLSRGEYPPCDMRIGRLSRWRVSTHNRWIEGQTRPKD